MKLSRRRQPKEKTWLDERHKIKANRANAQASTGPKTADGRARAGRDHALSLAVRSNPALLEEVETLAREIAGPDTNAETQVLAREVAEAQIDLRRVRYARHRLLSDVLADPHYENGGEKMAVLRRLLRKARTSAQQFSRKRLLKSY